MGREICGELDAAERREWWLADGLGGYASGTLAGSLTRRYHGLLIAPLRPPLGRDLIAAKADATLVDGDRHRPLFTNRWAGGAVDPAGYVQIERFALLGRMPVWRFALGDLALEQAIWMDHGESSTRVGFRRVRGERQRPPLLRIAVLAGRRDHHGSLRRDGLAVEARLEAGVLRLFDRGDPLLNVHVHGGELRADATWVEGFDLPQERERGLDDREDYLRIGVAEIPLAGDDWCGLTLTRGQDAPAPLAQSRQRFLTRERSLLATADGALRTPEGDPPKWIRQLALAADGFLVRRPGPAGADVDSVIAGYPWFGDWGRDTMIALPGLCLATGRLDLARRILESYAGFVDRGMLPNNFPGAGDLPAYNTVDAALWYLEAWRAYLEAGGSEGAARRHFGVLESIVSHYRDGTRFGIGVDPADGLIRAGAEGVQLTWMDAKVGDWVVTPRRGKPVEVNALWYNGLCALGWIARRLGRDPGPYEALAGRVCEGFRRFRRGAGLGLYDCLDGPGGPDSSLRPNQILAVSLAFSPLDPQAQADVVAECGRHLLCTPGLRSLAEGESGYRGRYQGDVRARDGAYHQGPVWGWLLGHYVMAEYRVRGDRTLALDRLEPLKDQLRDAGLGTLSEIFDGDPPHRPRGAPAQAWSVGCALEAWWRLSRPYPDDQDAGGQDRP
ncbi:MAG: amylo-alpha-1,6-glucosidase [Chromatiales bacterium]|jgi:4-alpha-glucanotransferase